MATEHTDNPRFVKKLKMSNDYDELSTPVGLGQSSTLWATRFPQQQTSREKLDAILGLANQTPLPPDTSPFSSPSATPTPGSNLRKSTRIVEGMNQLCADFADLMPSSPKLTARGLSQDIMLEIERDNKNSLQGGGSPLGISNSIPAPSIAEPSRGRAYGTSAGSGRGTSLGADGKISGGSRVTRSLSVDRT